MTFSVIVPLYLFERVDSFFAKSSLRLLQAVPVQHWKHGLFRGPFLFRIRILLAPISPFSPFWEKKLCLKNTTHFKRSLPCVSLSCLRFSLKWGSVLAGRFQWPWWYHRGHWGHLPLIGIPNRVLICLRDLLANTTQSVLYVKFYIQHRRESTRQTSCTRV